ncbi:hypothetical protein C0995_003495 [Termitomyces sp. Mi166|nr:hypothetical protein C0995_003495 [Termitomyces sp. Mi166\
MSTSTSTPHITSSHIFSRQDVHNPAGDFSPGASPPLILAFLAIGLFALSMMGIFGWRRIQYTRIRGEIPGHQREADERPLRTGLGPRPRLWDLWTIDLKDGHKRVKVSTNDLGMTTEHETWDTIMPISAVVNPAKGDGTTSQTLEPATVPFYRWTRHIEPTATATEKGVPRTNAKGSNGRDERRMQVAVAIAMPYQQIPHHECRNMKIGTERGEEAAGGDDTFVYTIGVYECTWGHDNG